MSVITPDAPTFNRPVAPAPDIDRDNELLNYYFDSTWTTKDIADHFKLTVPQVAAWFQRSDIAALIDFVTAANDRRARDIARENLPGTIDILLRISRLRNDDKVSRAASSALITFARGRAHSKSAAKHASAATTRSRRADTSSPRDMHNTPADRDDHSASQSPGRDAESPLSGHQDDISPPANTDSTADTTNPPSAFNRLDNAIAPRIPALGSPADLFARAGSASASLPAPQLVNDPSLSIAAALNVQTSPPITPQAASPCIIAAA